MSIYTISHLTLDFVDVLADVSISLSAVKNTIQMKSIEKNYMSLNKKCKKALTRSIGDIYQQCNSMMRVKWSDISLQALIASNKHIILEFELDKDSK